MSDRHLAVKVALSQWDGFLADMAKGARSAYIRTAIRSYMDEHPVLTAIPILEPANEPVRQLPVQVWADESVAAWIEQAPHNIRSYLIRHIINWYRRRNPPQQAVLTGRGGQALSSGP